MNPNMPKEYHIIRGFNMNLTNEQFIMLLEHLHDVMYFDCVGNKHTHTYSVNNNLIFITYKRLDDKYIPLDGQCRLLMFKDTTSYKKQFCIETPEELINKQKFVDEIIDFSDNYINYLKEGD